jgi:N-carbamoyl-L-amino-acid hydrolase
MMRIDGERLLRDLRRLAEFGQVSTGVDRTAFTAQDLAARHWVRERLEEAGLKAGLDRFGTVYGRGPGSGKAVLIGSHTDTVPRGGWLDGALGVVYGIEIARAAAAAGRSGSVDVISFQDEEGTFVPCLGSKAFCGILDDAEVERAVSADGRVLRELLSGLGLPDRAIGLAKSRHVAFLEAHIEQGPRLEASGSDVGIVTGIVGIRRFQITAEGQADHAGTTPIRMRKDAGAALLQVASRLLESMPRWAESESVWNIGKIEFKPGAANVVPAEASLIFEFRDLDVGVLARIEADMHRAVAEIARSTSAPIAAKLIGKVEPVETDARLQDVFRTAAEGLGKRPMTMPSGAGHDTMVMAHEVPSMLMFVPSIGGRSHDISENTKDEDIVGGCQVMAAAIDAMFHAGWVDAQ